MYRFISPGISVHANRKSLKSRVSPPVFLSRYLIARTSHLSQRRTGNEKSSSVSPIVGRWNRWSIGEIRQRFEQRGSGSHFSTNRKEHRGTSTESGSEGRVGVLIVEHPRRQRRRSQIFPRAKACNRGHSSSWEGPQAPRSLPRRLTQQRKTRLYGATSQSVRARHGCFGPGPAEGQRNPECPQRRLKNLLNNCPTYFVRPIP